jgi:hypothetical protein
MERYQDRCIVQRREANIVLCVARFAMPQATRGHLTSWSFLEQLNAYSSSQPTLISLDHLMPLSRAGVHLFVQNQLLVRSNHGLSCSSSVIHIATPLPTGSGDGEVLIFKPAIEGLQNVLDGMDRVGGVTTFVLTSSMSAMSPKPDPPLKSEAHWSDADLQKSNGNWYACIIAELRPPPPPPSPLLPLIPKRHCLLLLHLRPFMDSGTARRRRRKSAWRWHGPRAGRSASFPSALRWSSGPTTSPPRTSP